MLKSLNLIIIFLAFTLSFSVHGETEKSFQGRYLGAKTTVYPEWFKDSFFDLREDINDAAKQGKRVMIFFHQEGCPYCNLMVERNLSQANIQQLMREQLDVIEFNMWGDKEVTGLDGSTITEKEFAESLKVQFTPTLLAFNESGKIILRLNGYIPPASFKTALNFITQRQEKKISYREYLAANKSPNALKGQLNNESFYMQPPYDLSRKSDKPLAIFFEQKDCPNCDRLHQDIINAPGIRQQLKRFNSIQLDMWSAKDIVTPNGKTLRIRDWAKKLGVTFAPTIIFLNSEGNEVIRSEAFFKRFHTESIFDYVASKAYLTQANFQRYISARAEHIRDQGKDVDLWR